MSTVHTLLANLFTVKTRLVQHRPSLRRQADVQDAADASDASHARRAQPVQSDWLFSACEPHIADLVHRIDVQLAGKPKRVLQFIGAESGVGASSVALAYSSASAALRQRKVLLLCADERQCAPSVLDYLSAGRPAMDAIVPLHGTLHYGALSGERDVDLDTQRMIGDAALWNQLTDAFDEIVVDCRPIDVSPEALAVASRSDGVVVVIRAAHTSDARVRDLLGALDALTAPTLGAVLNQRVPSRLFDARGNDE